MARQDSLRKLHDQYHDILKRARDRQRLGDDSGYTALVEQAQEVARLIDELHHESSS